MLISFKKNKTDSSNPSCDIADSYLDTPDHNQRELVVSDATFL